MERHNERMVIRSFHLPRSLMRVISDLSDRGLFNNPSEAIRMAVMTALPDVLRVAELLDDGGRGCVVKSLFIPRELRKLALKLVERGVFKSESEVYRFSLVYFLIRMRDVIKGEGDKSIALR